MEKVCEFQVHDVLVLPINVLLHHINTKYTHVACHVASTQHNTGSLVAWLPPLHF